MPHASPPRLCGEQTLVQPYSTYRDGDIRSCVNETSADGQVSASVVQGCCNRPTLRTLSSCMTDDSPADNKP